MGQHTVKLSVDLQVLKSSYDDIQKVLNTLKPDTRAFSSLSSVIKAMGKDIENVETNLQKGFSSTSEFSATEKVIEKISTSLAKAGTIVGKINFSDLKLDSSIQDQYKRLSDDLKKAQDEYNRFKKSMVSNVLSQGDNKTILKGLDPNLVNKNFDQIVKRVSEGVKAAEAELQKLQQAYKELQSQMTKAQNVQSKVNSGTKDTLAGLLDPADFKKFFAMKQSGDVIFKSVRGGGIQQQFLQYLKSEFSIPENKIEELRNKTAKQIQDILGSGDFWDNVVKGQKAQEVNLLGNIGDMQANVTDFTQLGEAFGLAGAQATQFGSNVINIINALNNLKSSAISSNGAIQNLPNSLSAASSQLQMFKSSLEQTKTEFLKYQAIQNNFNAIKNTVANFMGFTQILNLVKRGVKDAGKNIKQLDTVMNGIAIVTKMSTADLWDQVDAYTKMAQQYGVTTKGAYQVSKIYYQQGLETKDVLALTEQTLKLSKISGLDYATTTDYMTTAIRGFKMQMSEASKVVDVYSALAANTAVSQQELAEAMTRTASSMESVGSTFEETSAMISTMVAVTRQSASNIGSALKSIASRYGEMKKAPEDLIDSEGEALSFNKVDAALQSVGINMKTTENQFRSFTDVIIELSDKWQTLESTQQRYIATQFAGNRQQSRFLALVSNGELLKNNLKVAEESEGTGTAQALTALDSLESKITQVQNAYQQFYLSVGIEDVWKGFLDGAKNTLNTLNSFPKLFDKIPVVALSAIANLIKVGKIGLMAGLQDLATILTPAIQSALQQAGIVAQKEGQKLGNQTKQGILSGIRKGMGNGAQLASVIGAGISSAALMINQQSRQGQIIGGALNTAGGLVQGGAGVFQLATGNYVQGAINLFSAINSVVAGISSIVETSEEKIARISNEAKQLSDRATELKGQERSLQNLKTQYDDLRQKQYDSEESAIAFKDIQNQIANQYPELIESLNAVGDATINAAAMDQKLAEARQASAQATLDAINKELQAQKLNKLRAQQIFDSRTRNSTFGQNKATSDTINRGQINFSPLESYDWYNSLITVRAGQSTLPGALSYDLSVINDIFASKTALDQLLEDVSDQTYDSVINWINKYKDQNILLQDAISGIVNTLKNDNGNNNLYTILNQYVGESLDYLEAQLSFREAVREYPINATQQDRDALLEKYNQYAKAYHEWAKSTDSSNESVEAELKYFSQSWEDLGQAVKDYQSTAKLQLQRVVENQRQQINKTVDNIQENILNNNQISSLISKKISDDGYADQSALQEEIKALQDQWKSLDKAARDTITSRSKDLSNYNSVDAFFDGMDVSIDSLLYDFFRERIQLSSQLISQRFANFATKQSDKTTRGAAKQAIEDLIGPDIITETRELVGRALVNVIQQIADYSPDYEIREVGQAGNILESVLDELPREIQQAIIENGMLTKQGIENSLALIREKKQAVTTDEEKDIFEQAEYALSIIQEHLVSNLNLSLQQYKDQVLTKLNDERKNISKLSSGASSSEIENIITSLNTWAKQQGKDKIFSVQQDIIFDSSGKLIMANESLSEAYEIWREHLKSGSNTISNDLAQLKELVDELNNLNDSDFSIGGRADEFLTTNTELLRELFGQQVFDDFFALDEFTGSYYLQQEGVANASAERVAELKQAAIDAITNLQSPLNTVLKLIDLEIDSLSIVNEFKKGDYSKLSKPISELAETAPKALGEIEIKAVEQYQSGLKTLINDFLNYGKEYVLNHSYQGISSNIVNELADNGITAFLKAYGKQLGNTIEQQNDLALRANEAVASLSEKSSVKDIVSSLEFFGDVAYATKSNINSLANIANLDVDLLLGESKQINGETYYQLLTDSLKDLDAAFTTSDNWILQKAISTQKHLNQLEQLLNNDNLSVQQQQSLKQLLSNLGIQLRQGVELFEEKTNGKTSVSSEGKAAIQDAANNINEQVSKIVTRVILTDSQRTAQDAINALQNISKIQNSGSSDLSEMQGILDTIKHYNKTFTGTLTNGAFEYSTALHGFVMSASTVQQYIKALTRALQQATDAVSQQQIMDQLRSTYLQLGDIEGFVNTFKDESNMPQWVWEKQSAELIQKIKSGKFTSLPLGMQTYVDQMQAVIDRRNSAWENIAKAFSESNELTLQDITKNMDAFIGTDLQGADANTILKRIRTSDLAVQYVQSQSVLSDQKNITSAFGMAANERREKIDEILLQAVKEDGSFTLQQIEDFCKLYGETAFNVGGELSEYAAKYFSKEGDIYKATTDLKQLAKDTQHLYQRIDKIEKEQEYNRNETLEGLFSQLIDAQNNNTIIVLEKATEAQLAQAKELSKQIGNMVTYDEGEGTITFTPQSDGSTKIREALQHFKDNFTVQEYKQLQDSIQDIDKKRYDAISSLLNNNGKLTDELRKQLDEASLKFDKNDEQMDQYQIQQLIDQVENDDYAQSLKEQKTQLINNYKNSVIDLLSFSHQSKDTVEKLFKDYSQITGKQTDYAKYFKDADNGQEVILQSNQINSLLEDFGITESSKIRNAIQSMGDTLNTILSNLSSNGGFLNQNEVQVLNNAFALDLTHGFQDATKQAQIKDAYRQFIIDNIENLSDNAYDLAINYLKLNSFEGFFKTIEGFGIKFNKDEQHSIETAALKGEFAALAEFEERLGGFYQTIIDWAVQYMSGGLTTLLSNLPSLDQKASFTTTNSHDFEAIKTIADNSNDALKLLSQTEEGEATWLVESRLEFIKYLQTYIQDSSLSKSAKRDWIKRLKQMMPMSADQAVKTLLSSPTNNFDQETIEDIAESLGQTQDKFDEFKAKYFTQQGEYFKFINAAAAEMFLQDNEGKLSQKEINEYQKQLSQQKRSENVAAALRNIILNYNNLSDDLIQAYANARNAEFKDVQKEFGYDEISGQYHPQQSLEDFVKQSGTMLDSSMQIAIESGAKARLDAFEDVFSKMATSVSEGSQEIQVTEQNKNLLYALFRNRIPGMTLYDVNDEIYKYVISSAEGTIDKAIEVLERIRDSQKLQEQYKIQGADDNYFNNLINNLLSAKKQASPQNLLSEVLDNYTNVAYDKIFRLSKALGLEISDIATQDVTTGQYKLNLDNIATLQEAVWGLFNEGLLSQQAVNHFQTQISNITWEESPEAALANIIQNMDNISNQMIENLANKTGIAIETIQSYLTENGGTYRLDSDQLQPLVDEIGLDLTDWLLSLIENQVDDVLEILSSLSNKVISGTNNTSEMKQVLDRINDSKADTQKKLSYSDIYEYNATTHSFVLNQLGIAEQLKRFNEEILEQYRDSPDDLALLENQRESFMHSLGEQIDIKSFLDATGDLQKTQAKQAFSKAINNYNFAAQQTGYQEIGNELIEQALDGSFDAISQIYSILGRTMTFDEQSSLLNSKANKLISATDVFTAAVGTSIDKYAADLLQLAGGTAEQQGTSDVWKVTKGISPDKLAEAYMQAYYKGVEQNLSQDRLDDLLKKSWDAAAAKDTGITNALSKAASMSLSEFADFLLTQGITLTDTIMSKLETEGIFSMLDNNNLRLNLRQFANKFNVDQSSKEFLDAYSSLQDTVIEEQTWLRESIESQIKSILQAKPGDILKVPTLANLFKQSSIFEDFGLAIEEGIVTIVEESNLLGVAGAIAQACSEAEMIIPEQLQAIQDAIQEVLQSFIDALSSGMQGNLDSAGKRNVISQAKQLLGEDLTDKSFIRTADGFKLTTDAAIQMYSALKQIDSVQASKLFDNLSERTFGSTAGMQTMTGQMQRIKDLQDQIAQAAKNAAKARASGDSDAAENADKVIGKLQQQLQLYQQIAQARMTGDPSSYDFMGQSLPDYLKGPENYWNAWGNAFEAMRNAAENGGYAIQDFYNIVNEMNNIAGLTGKQFQIFGQTLNGGIQGMTKLIEKGFQSIKNIDGKGAKVTLEGIGIDFASGAAGMSGNIEDGIHAMAQSQIDMLDGLIAFLQTIVAMQQLGSVDTDFSGSIDMGEIFADANAGFSEGFTNEFNTFRNNIVNLAKDNQDLQNALQNTTITMGKVSMSMKDLFTLGATEFRALGVDEKLFTEAFNAFYQLVQSQDFDLQNPLSQMNLDLIAQSGLNLQYQMPDGNTLVIKDGQWIMSSEPGEYTVDGQTFDNASDAIAYRNQKTSEEAIKQFTDSRRGKGDNIVVDSEGTTTIEIAGQTFSIKADENKGFEINGQHCDTWEQVEQKMIDQYVEWSNTTNTPRTTEEASIALKFDTKPEIQSVSQLSSQQIQKLKANNLETKAQIQEAYNEDPIRFEAKYDFKLSEQTDVAFDNDLQNRMQQSAIEVEANVTANGESVEISGPVEASFTAIEVEVPQPVEASFVATDVDTSGVSLNNEGQGDETSPLTIFTESLGNQLSSAGEVVARSINEATSKNGEATISAIDSLGQTIESASSKVTDNLGQLVNNMQKFVKKQQNVENTGDNNQKIKSSNKQDDSTVQAQGMLQAAFDVLNQATTAVNDAGAQLSATSTEVSGALDSMAGAASSAAGSMQATASAIQSSYNSLPSGTKTVNLQVNVSVSASAAKGTINSVTWDPHSQTFAKGNVALASGQKTLMGELGPELVVSDGRYFVVGQSGAEMVNLAPDAIVFNHLQTRKLLSSGHTSRGRAITSESKAVSRAKGTGPAMASAEAVLAALKQIRAMWQAMLGASMKDLGALAGNEGGGGGGGGGGGKKPQQLKAILDDIERWYNLVRQIAKLEQDITYQQTLQAKLQSDRVANGQALYKSYKKEIDFLDQEIVRNQQLAMLQKSYYEAKRKEFTESDYGRFYTYDENGLLQLKDGIDKGMDVLFKLNEKNVYGQTSGAATNAKTQIEYLRSIGFDTQNLKYNGDGTKLDPSDESYKDNPDKIYEDMMNNFWDNLDGWKDDLDSIYDEYHEQLNTVLENEDKRNQLLQTIIDNQLSVQQDVLKAIEEREQKLIDELQDQRDALQDSTERFIDGLSDQLKQERQMYENEENERELVKLRRQVAILQRSGGSASQIRSLQEQIAGKEQDQYFDQQQQQIAAIQRASDLQIERLDSQIDLMTKALEYQKQNGLLWEEVYQIMASTPQQIRQFIMQNTPDFQSASALDVAEKIRDIDLRINEWVSYRDDQSAPDMSDGGYYDWTSYFASRDRYYGDRADEDLKAQAKAEFDRVLKDTGDINLAGEAADAIFKAVLGEMPRIINEEQNSNNKNTIKDKVQQYIRGDGSSNYSSYYDDNWGGPNTRGGTMKGGSSANTSSSNSKITASSNQPFSFGSWQAAQDLENLSNQIETVSKSGAGSSVATESLKNAYRNMYNTYSSQGKLTDADKKKYNKYDLGGLVDYTGLAQVDGTPSRPEAFLNAQQTELLRNHLFGSSNSLLALARNIVQQMHGITYSSSTLSKEDNGVSIGHIDVNVNVKEIANDYDVRTIGNTIMDEMVKIARKSGTRSLSRR